MKKVILFVCFLVVGYSSYATDDSKKSKTTAIVKTQREQLSSDTSKIHNRQHVNKANLLVFDCFDLGYAVYKAALNEGWSREDAFDAGNAIMMACLFFANQ
ncbi:hypothetical protein [Flagellimonas lutaonensis]|uniref:Secreted protein n=1 Tax=Flagellimonas lutaonensis TaxID=516051 RepID=A0A0D5YT19_9FLAO|nr:hypothetical protein [Allomuricauda lutaonensis]AKA35477.1 hypothetical protein VC82_1872 [Allomuricauda lutaonensis]